MRRAGAVAPPTKWTATMDLLSLLDQLDDLVFHARAVPLGGHVIVDRQAIFGVLDQIRETVPEEFERARRAVAERDEIFAAAQRDAQRLVADAKARAAATPDVASLDARLAQITRELADLRGTGAPPLTAAAIEQLRPIMEAAERTAEGIQREAHQEAARIVAETLRDAQRCREQAAGEATAIVERARQATEAIVERAERAGTDVTSTAEQMRVAGAGLVETAAQQSLSLRAELAAINAQLAELGGSRGRGATKDHAAAPADASAPTGEPATDEHAVADSGEAPPPPPTPSEFDGPSVQRRPAARARQTGPGHGAPTAA